MRIGARHPRCLPYDDVRIVRLIGAGTAPRSLIPGVDRVHDHVELVSAFGLDPRLERTASESLHTFEDSTKVLDVLRRIG